VGYRTACLSDPTFSHLVQCRLVTDRQKDGRANGHTHDDNIAYRASIASRGKIRCCM